MFIFHRLSLFDGLSSADGKSFATLAKMDFRYHSTEVIVGFTGVMLGLFAQGDDGYADFDWFEYTTE